MFTIAYVTNNIIINKVKVLHIHTSKLTFASLCSCLLSSIYTIHNCMFYISSDSTVGLFTPASPQTHEESELHYHITTAVSLGNRNFQFHYNLMGPLWYVGPKCHYMGHDCN